MSIWDHSSLFENPTQKKEKETVQKVARANLEGPDFQLLRDLKLMFNIVITIKDIKNDTNGI